MMLRAGRTAALALAALLAVLVPAAPAGADDPQRLQGQLTDRVGALGNRQGAAQEALGRLRAETGLQLFVVFVPSFDGTPAQQWADQTARRSDLGGRDAVLAVATGDRAYAYSFAEGYLLTDAQLEVVERVAIEPALAENDWAGAVIGAADGYRSLLQGRPVTAPDIRPGDPAPAGGTGSGFIGSALVGPGLLCLLAPLAAVAGGALLWWRRRRRTAPAGPGGNGTDRSPGVSTQELANRANTLLVELDDDLRASERELALATAGYGAAATRTFQAALDTARQEVAEAFRLRLSLDEQPPPDEAAHRALLGEIIRRCEAADARLDAESEAFDRLRDLEGQIEQVSAELGQRLSAAQARLPTAASAVQALRSRYAGATVAAVAGNVEQARERLVFAGTALQRAGEALGGGDRSAAALAVRGAEQAVDQAEQLLGAIERAGADLDAARTGAEALIIEVESDLAAARQVQATAADPAARSTLSAAVAGAEQSLAAARAALAGPTVDPTSAVRQLEHADAILDRALAGARDAAERTDHAGVLLAQVLPVARAEIAAAADFVTTRRGAVGSQARVWLAEAQRHLAEAENLAPADPVTALAAAQQAHRLGASAGQAARDDVAQWGGPGGYAGTPGDPMGAFAGAVLGGILSGAIRQGHGGGFGGGWGGGGFGGSASRGRRTGGGGGRRGGGGRF